MSSRTRLKSLGLMLVGASGVALLAACSVTVGPPAVAVYHPAPAPVVVATAPPPPPAPAEQAEAAPASDNADPQLQQLLAPIALYPDPLLAILLPACSFPDDVAQANTWVQANPNPSDDAINANNWAPSVKGLCHYPTVLNYLASNADWTASVGSAFSQNQADVFAAIQDLRVAAQAKGNLVSTPQLMVVTTDNVIAIQPPNPQVMFVPVYDPMVVYTSPFVITYGPSFVVGPWLVGGVVWDGGFIAVGDWHGGWGWRGGVWVRDPYWHPGPRWFHDDRWGRPPFVARDRWARGPHMRGDFHAVARSAMVRRQVATHNRMARESRSNARTNARAGERGRAERPGARPERPAANRDRAANRPQQKQMETKNMSFGPGHNGGGENRGQQQKKKKE